MGSFDKLLKPAITAGATAFGGPVGGTLAGFGTTALAGGDLGDSLIGGLSAGGGAAASTPSFGSKFMTNLGFGSNPWQNLSTGGNLILSARNPMQTSSDPYGLLVPPPKRPGLMEVLNERSY